MEPKKSVIQERHLLVFNYKNNRYIELNSDIFTLGRDSSKDVRIKNDLISRDHATFIRTPISQSEYAYRVVDGGLTSKSSTNGIYINSKRCYIRMLQHGDIISFSNKYEAIYLKIGLNNQRLAQYLSILPYVKVFDQKNRQNIATWTSLLCKINSPSSLRDLAASLLN